MNKAPPRFAQKPVQAAAKTVATPGAEAGDQPSEKSSAPRFPMALNRLVAKPAAAGQHTAQGQRSAGLLRPQRHMQQVQQASESAARQQQPQGLGLDSVAVRQRMVQRLQAGGVSHTAVLAAFLQIDRHRFVDSALAGQAYEDTSLPIGLSQTISKPSVVARMLSLLLEGATARETGNLGRVLEVGSGCGYQAALLARLADPKSTVVSIERLQGLADKAVANLAAAQAAQDAAGMARGADLRVLHGDGRLGHAPRAPYQSIIAAAGGDDLPQAWIDQLAVGGRLVAPVHNHQNGGQALLVLDRRAEGVVSQRHEAVLFVPLKSGVE
jgi:protein-L-isoaspartate(D-aspartate) O-methyltransferase